MKLAVTSLAIPDVKLIAARRFTDARGYFVETYVRGDFAAAAIDCDFVQDNQAYSRAPGTVRGMHFQIAPFAQAKLIRVIRGRIFDAVVDLRRSSPTYGRHVTVELDSATETQLYVPAGFAHGYCSLEPDTEIIYKVDNVYSAVHERGVSWCDPALGIAWPVESSAAILSDKDRELPLLSAMQDTFA
jgi:dTDP-4-dehydrorhamnose 3,5-epimerase